MARWTSQLKPRCEKFRLRDFRTSDAQRIFNDISRENPELCRSTFHHLKSLLSAIFKHAIQQGYLNGPNPIREVGLPTAPEGEDTHAHSIEEITRILLYVPLQARAMLGLAGFAGFRRSEIGGELWENYDGKEIKVTQSVWEGHVNEPKTRSSKSAVPVIPALARILNTYHEQCGKPKSGPMFKSEAGTHLNLNNALNRIILPALNRCATCGNERMEHTGADHQYKRDESRPMWHGWHAFRRGLGTNLAELGVDELTIQRILRHANVATTRQHYIKVRNPKVEAAMQLLDAALCASSAPDHATRNSTVLN